MPCIYLSSPALLPQLQPPSSPLIFNPLMHQNKKLFHTACSAVFLLGLQHKRIQRDSATTHETNGTLGHFKLCMVWGCVSGKERGWNYELHSRRQTFKNKYSFKILILNWLHSKKTKLLLSVHADFYGQKNILLGQVMGISYCAICTTLSYLHSETWRFLHVQKKPKTTKKPQESKKKKI